MLRWMLSAVAALTVAACLPEPARFETCQTYAQCGPGGVCEPFERACSFVDATCASGRRFGDLTAPEVAGTCVAARDNALPGAYCERSSACTAGGHDRECLDNRCASTRSLAGGDNVFVSACAISGTVTPLVAWGQLFATTLPWNVVPRPAATDSALALGYGVSEAFACWAQADDLSAIKTECVGLLGGVPATVQEPAAFALYTITGATWCGANGPTVTCRDIATGAARDTQTLGGEVVHLRSGADYICAASANEYRCWGRRAFQGTVGGAGLRDLDAGADHVCLIRGGRVYCRGGNATGQVDGAPGADVADEVEVDIPGEATTVAAGPTHSCAANADGEIFCWGAFGVDDAGPGVTAIATDGVPLSQRPLTQVARDTLAAIDHQTCALLIDDRTFCWGVDVKPRRGCDRTPL